MSVHTHKCEVVYFHPDRNHRLLASQVLKVGLRRIVDNQYLFQEIKWVNRARYLGLYYGPDSPFESCTDELFDAGQRAMYAVISKLRRKGLFIPRIALQCFDSQIRAILSYGVQVWGPHFLLQLLDRPRDIQGRYCYFDRAMEDRMVGIQRTFLRSLASVGRVPDNRLLFREFGQQPLHIHWATLVYRFWNKLVKAKNNIFHNVFREEIRMALLSDCTGSSWGSLVLRGLRCLGHWPDIPVDGELEVRVNVLASKEINIEALMLTLKERFDEDWVNPRLHVQPREFVSDGAKPGVKMCRYTHWMGLPQPTTSYIPMVVYTSLLRFRLGAWALEANRPTGRPREQRWCRVCNHPNSVEDEYHVLMECVGYAEARANFARLGVVQGATMLQIMSIEDQLGLARIIHGIRLTRLSMMGRT
ncbi:hypothetical protein Vretimale_19606 [Volvox reticuliferus]|nr:hypothetical protein Vretifemale_16685 [Volvox reticuliferus]GIM17065.1 hypothetical protein Vretimale_19606 [Volvox reticuliferus]